MTFTVFPSLLVKTIWESTC